MNKHPPIYPASVAAEAARLTAAQPDLPFEELRGLAAREAGAAAPELIAPNVVEHPAHYTFGRFEVIDVLEDWFPAEPLLWQVGKYIARALHKGRPVEDLRKARWYLDRKIAQLEGRGRRA